MSQVPLKRICVYCGSSPGRRPEYAASAVELGKLLAQRQIELVYGGSCVGLMGKLADAVLENGGHVIGVIPDFLVAKEVVHPALPDLRTVGSMHERKELMARLADGFIALPGGLGTLEELFEMLTWSQLGLHAKPCGLLNLAGYFEHLLAFLRHASSERFIPSEHLDLLLVEAHVPKLLDGMQQFEGKSVPKWLDRDSVSNPGQ